MCFIWPAAGITRAGLRFWTQLTDIFASCGALTLFAGALLALVSDAWVATAIAFSWLVSAPLILVSRSAARRFLYARGLWRIDVVVVGNQETSSRATRVLTADPSMGYRVVALVDAAEVKSFRDNAEWVMLAAMHRADCVAITTGITDSERERAMFSALSLAKIPVMIIPEMGPMSVIHCRQQYVYRQDALLLTYQSRINAPVSRMLKVILDYVVSSLLCLILAPLFLTIVILVRMDGGPAFYRHRRVGLNGRSFECMKFRSMAVDSERFLTNLLQSDSAAAEEWSRTRKLKSDPRITSIGKMLRKTSLDELPQLLNVLRGEMSLVGPRPVVMSELALYGPAAGYYTHVKPGLTGLWQASGRSDTSFEERVKLDVWYVVNWCFRQDIAILLMTIPAVLFRKGAA